MYANYMCMCVCVFMNLYENAFIYEYINTVDE